jgi:SAM-dependent methyltransferase
MLKYQLIQFIRSLGMLKSADRVKFYLNRLKNERKNKQFIQDYADFSVPPYELAFDAYNHIDWYEYREGGLLHAQVFADIISEYKEVKETLSILEWGCGPARLIRHLSQLLNSYSLHLTGTDYNLETIHWCKKNIEDIEWIHNQLMPPLAIKANRFSVIYNFSVFTHLSEEVQIAWVKELWRILQSGGLFICSTHGSNYQYLLTKKEEIEKYNVGELVIQDQYSEGKKWFFAIHPEKFVKDTLLKDFVNVRLYPLAKSANMLQDIWIAEKP